MRFTIERIRTLIVIAGVLAIVAIGAFLAIGRFKNSFNRRDIPKRLGIDIQQEANGVTYTQAHGGRTIFKIHASRVVQLRNQHATLHDVQIELYGRTNSGGDRVVDRISGDEFDYDQKSGIATAAGPVDITLMRPTAGQQLTLPGGKSVQAPKPPAQIPPSGIIHVHTSGITFNQQTGIVTTPQRVEFSTPQASGSSTGASYDSDRGFLVLDREVLLNARPGNPAAAGNAANSIQLRARHAEFERDHQIGRFRTVTAQTRAQQATASEAEIFFRDDGSVARLNVSGGVVLTTAAGSRLTAPTGQMEFNEKNQPRRGHLDGGVTMSSSSAGRTLNGAAPTMDLEFASGGVLRRAHLEHGVEMRSHEQTEPASNGQQAPVELTRTWNSPVANIDFRQVARGRVELAGLRGTGGVVLSGETRRGSRPSAPSRLTADELTGQFGPHSTLLSMAGAGHAGIQQTTASGDRQTASGDRLQVRFTSSAGLAAGSNPPGNTSAGQIQSAQLDGNVTLVEQPAPKPNSAPPPPLRATAGRAAYESAGQWLRLTNHPRVNDAGMELTADRVDVAQQSGDAFAHGNVKATWLEPPAADPASHRQPAIGASANPMSLGGRGPAHIVAAEAQVHRSTGEATFRGHARLWQDDNSISAPLLILDRQKQTLVAKTGSASDPVVAILLTAASPAAQPGSGRGRASAPAVVRIRGGDLWYSSLDRKALFRAAPLSSVVAQSGAVQSQSGQVELYLAPTNAPQSSTASAPAQVERIVAQDHVLLTSQGRRGTGQQLVYTSQSGDYVLTGTASQPPTMSDPGRGSVTGAALIFHSRDDSVSIEGNGRETVTQTTAPR